MVKNEQQPPPPADGDTEASASNTRELQKKKRRKFILYIILFLIVIAVFDITVMKVRTPKFRLSAAALTNFNAGAPACLSLWAMMNA